MADHIPYARQWVNENDIQAVAKTLESDFLTTGPKIREFEQELCRLTGARHAVACTNGTAALHLACLALKLSPKDLGMTSPISFLASANCMEFCGGRTDFIDIDPHTLCLSPAELETYCLENPAPKVVIPVDFAGIPADLPAIFSLADRFGFHVIEDAAHSLGSAYTHEGKGFACGACAHSDMAVFSFHAVKTVTCCEGGAVMTNDDTLARRLKHLRNHGMIRSPYPQGNKAPWVYEMETLGYNYRISDIHCALGISQISRLEEFRTRRQNIVSRYNRAFKKDHRLILPPKPLANTACPHLYPIQFKGGQRVREQVFHELLRNHIRCQVHYIPIYRQPYYAEKYGYAKGKCPGAETYYSRCLSLPLYPALTDREVETVARCVLDAL